MSKLSIIQKQLSSWNNYNYLVYDPEEKKGVIVDASEGCEVLVEEAKKLGITIEKILLTHTHFDHINGLPLLLEEIPNIPIYVHTAAIADVESFGTIHEVKDEDSIAIGKGQLTVIHTPGHKPDAVCFYNDEVIFTGDTVFINAHGRIDLPGGSLEQLRQSFAKLRELPDHLIVYAGHAYGGEKSTLGAEKDNV